MLTTRKLNYGEMKKLICLIGLICSGGISFGQLSPSVVQHPHEEERCGQHHMMQKMQLEDPVRYQSMVQESVESLKSHYSASTEKATGVVYTIPVVFHILHMNGTENISAEQCQDAINILNRDYRRLNFDADQVNAPFQGMQADAEIQFVLATKAPNGACFNGITRTVNALSNDGSSGQAQVQAIVDGNDVYNGIWPHNQYLNIFVCKSIGGAAGYAYYPNGNSTASVSNMYYGGIFVLSNYVGSIGTSNVNKSRTLTHECGHWMNLAHVWGSNNNPGDPASCNTDDGVQDTPNWEWQCPITLRTTWIILIVQRCLHRVRLRE